MRRSPSALLVDGPVHTARNHAAEKHDEKQGSSGLAYQVDKFLYSIREVQHEGQAEVDPPGR